MTTALLIIGIALVIAALAGMMFAFVMHMDEDHGRAGWGWAGMLIALIIVVPTFRTYDHRYQTDQCRDYARVNDEMEVKFQDLNYWNYGCYAKIDNKWVLTSNINIVVFER